MKLLATVLLCATTLSFGQWAGWTVVQKPMNGAKAITSFKGQYYVGANPGVVQHSINGKTWKATDLPSITCVNAVANNGAAMAFVGCGSASVSTDGLSWRTVQLDKGTNLVTVTMKDSVGWALSDSGALYVSNRDFSQWTRFDSLPPVATRALLWDGTQWVAFTDSGVVATSPDARGWHVVVSRGPTYVTSACYFKGHYFVLSGGQSVMQSEDLMYWSPLDAAYNVTNLGDRLVKERFLNNGDFAWSTDGVTWTTGKRLPSYTYNNTVGLVQGDSGIVAVTDQKQVVHIAASMAPDSLRALQTRFWTGVADCRGRPLFMGYGVSSGPLDALTRESPDTLQMNAVACNDSVVVAAGQRQDSILVRGNGKWQYSKLATSKGKGWYLPAAIWTGHEFVVGGEANAFISSYGNWKDGNGLLWNNETSAYTAPTYITAIAANDSILLLGGSTGEMARAVNWKTWTQIVTGRTGRFLGLVWGKDKFLASYYDTTVMTSPDGTTWTSAPFRVDNKVRRIGAPIVYGAGKFFAYTQDSLVAASSDGKTWESLGKVPDRAWGTSINMIVSNGSLIFAGNYGLIATRIVDSAAVGVTRPIERKPMLLRRDGGYAIPVPQDVVEARLLTYDGRVCETIVAGNGELFVRPQGRTGRFVLSWKEGAANKRMALPLVLMGR